MQVKVQRVSGQLLLLGQAIISPLSLPQVYFIFISIIDTLGDQHGAIQVPIRVTAEEI